MPTEHSDRVRNVFLNALDLDPAKRDAFLAEACGGDERLRSEVEALLISAVSTVATVATETAVWEPLRGDGLNPGDVLSGRFKIVRHIASGGMGAVYEAEDLRLRERVALKTILGGAARNQGTVERFKREIYLARKVTHVNVCRIFDFAEDKHPQRGDLIFLTMELLPGDTLFKRIRSSGPMTTGEALRIVIQLAAGMSAAHEAGVVHRDFKSGNVILVPSADSTRAVITDFGLAHGNRTETESLESLSRTGMISGSPPYMAPEQVKAGPITNATDIYALGVVMYEMVTGTWPFTGGNAWEIANKRLIEKPPSPRIHVPSLEPKWEKAILRCLEREPQDRFRSALDVVRFLEGEVVKPAPRVQRRRLLIASSIAALAIAAETAHIFLPKHGELRRSVAVLGFKNITAVPQAGWVSTALSEGLRSDLAAAGKLRSVSGEDIADFKKDLNVNDFDSLSKQSLTKLHRLGADLVVVGSYTDLGKESGGKIHLNVAIQDANRGETIDAMSADGAEDHMSELVSQIGARLRAKLGLGELSAQKEAELAVTQPNFEAAPFYSDGLNRLRTYDLSAARDLFQKAVLADPNFPFAHAALAETWSMLGYDARAKEEVKKAFDLSSKLPLEDRLSIEGRFHEMADDWKSAIESYSELFKHFPDDLEYGLRLAHAQMSSGNAAAGSKTLLALQKLPPPQGDDPRIELEHAETAASTGDYTAAQKAAASAMAVAKGRGAKVLELRSLNWECTAFHHLGQLPQARSACQQAIQLGSAVGDKIGTARAVNGLANIDNDQGNLQQALTGFEEAFRITNNIGDKRDMSGALNNIAMVLMSLGRFTEAREKYEQALVIQREIAFTNEIPRTLSNLGDVLHQQGNLREAGAMYAQAIRIARENQNKTALALALSSLGTVSLEQGDLTNAEKQYGEALSLQKSMNVREDAAFTLQGMGDLEFAKDRLETAEQHYREALSIQNEVGDRGGAALSQLDLARIFIEQAQFAGATKLLNGALAEFHAEKDRNGEALAHTLLSRCSFDQHDLTTAKQEIQSAEALVEPAGVKSVRFATGTLSARILAALQPKAISDAVQALRAIQKEARATGMLGYELEARLAIGQIELQAGDAALARSELKRIASEAASKGLALIAQHAIR